jgi:hypothetical protein
MIDLERGRSGTGPKGAGGRRRPEEGSNRIAYGYETNANILTPLLSFLQVVLSSIMGNWDRSLGAAPLLSSKLSHTISANNLANSFRHFNISYADTGLWGVHIITENLINIDDTVHFTLKEWQRMSVSPTAAEVERAKSQLKAATLLSLSDDGTKSVVEEIAKSIFIHGERQTPQQIEAAIDAVSPQDIMRVYVFPSLWLFGPPLQILAPVHPPSLWPESLLISSATRSVRCSSTVPRSACGTRTSPWPLWVESRVSSTSTSYGLLLPRLELTLLLPSCDSFLDSARIRADMSSMIY